MQFCGYPGIDEAFYVVDIFIEKEIECADKQRRRRKPRQISCSSGRRIRRNLVCTRFA